MAGLPKPDFLYNIQCTPAEPIESWERAIPPGGGMGHLLERNLTYMPPAQKGSLHLCTITDPPIACRPAPRNQNVQGGLGEAFQKHTGLAVEAVGENPPSLSAFLSLV